MIQHCVPSYATGKGLPSQSQLCNWKRVARLFRFAYRWVILYGNCNHTSWGRYNLRMWSQGSNVVPYLSGVLCHLHVIWLTKNTMPLSHINHRHKSSELLQSWNPFHQVGIHLVMFFWIQPPFVLHCNLIESPESILNLSISIAPCCKDWN